MSLSPDRRLQLRIVGALLVGGIAVVVAQARYGSLSAVSGLDLDEIERGGPRDVADRVTRLARAANVPSPSVAVAERPEPTCLTVDRGGSPTVVVTTGLLDRLDDDELDAALAHEVAHVANRDLPVALRLFARTREYAADRGAVSLTGDPASLASALRTLDDRGAERDLRLTASATLGIVHRPLPFESDADEDAEADETWVEQYLGDKETIRKYTVHGGQEEDPEPDPVSQAVSRFYDRRIAPIGARTKRALRWRPATHPSTEKRIEQLRAVERRREG